MGILIARQQCEALRGGEQDMRGVRSLSFASGLAGVASAVFDTNIQPHFFDRYAKITFDVSSERFERRDVERVQSVML